jgi:hypothetical protein
MSAKEWGCDFPVRSGVGQAARDREARSGLEMQRASAGLVEVMFAAVHESRSETPRCSDQPKESSAVATVEAAIATFHGIFMARNARTTPIARPPIRTPACSARVLAREPSFAIWGI